MSNCPDYSELRRMNDEDLVKAYNNEAKRTVVGTEFFLDEIIRRQTDRATKRMKKVAWSRFETFG